MKRLFTLLITLVFTTGLFSQTPEKMTYQAVIRNASGELIKNSPVGMKISILQGSATGTPVYIETQTPTTNVNGLITLEIGSGNLIMGNFSGIDWSAGAYFIKSETDPAGGTSYTITGTGQVSSVPYALYAKRASNGFSGNYNDLTNKPVLFDGTWASLSGKPTFSAVATTGAWADITGKPSTLAGYGITDAMNTSHAANSITSTNINNWTTAFGWGNHASAGYAVLPSQTGNSGRYLMTNGTTTSWSKLAVKGETGAADETLFEVKNKNGQTIFAVYNEGVRIYVDDGVVKGAKGGFAVGGFGESKAPSQQYFYIDPDSIRAYIDVNKVKGAKGGFAVGGFGESKGYTPLFLSMTPNNYFIGEGSGKKNTTGLYNSFVGFETGIANTSGKKNVFLGYRAGYSNDTASSNVFIGNESGRNNRFGRFNTFIGFQTGYSNTTGGYNVFLGYKAGYNATVSYNTFLGYQSGISNTTGYYNAFMGYSSGFSNTTGSSNVFIGNQSGYSNTTTSYNTFLGYQAGYANNASFNSFIGYRAGYNNTTGTYNSFIGYNAGYRNTTGVSNIFIGNLAGYNNTEANNNIFLGIQSGYHNTTGIENLFMGTKAGYSNTLGQYNVFLGFESGYSNIGTDTYNGNFNVFLGYQSGRSNTTGYSNVFIGDRTGTDNTTGIYNTFLGKFAGIHHASGNYNTFLGAQAGENKTSGNSNILIGNSAGGGNTSGDNNIFIGVTAGAFNTGSNNILIGRQAGYSGSYSNRLYIENSSTAALIYGEFDNRVVIFNGKVGVNGRNPVTNALEVLGNASKTTAGEWLANSDYRIKTQIQDIANAGDIIMRLHPVKFRYNDEWRTKNPTIVDKDYYNFIAQEFREVFPESVQGSGEYLDGQAVELLQMDSYNAQIVAIKALQEIIQQNRDQQKQIEMQKKEIDDLKALVKSLITIKTVTNNE